MTLLGIICFLYKDNPLTCASSRWPAFFTHLTHLGLCAYFWATTIQTSSFNRNGEESYALQRAPRVLQLMQVLLQASIITLRKSR